MFYEFNEQANSLLKYIIENKHQYPNLKDPSIISFNVNEEEIESNNIENISSDDEYIPSVIEFED